jgi:hypothetical protein
MFCSCRLLGTGPLHQTTGLLPTASIRLNLGLAEWCRLIFAFSLIPHFLVISLFISTQSLIIFFPFLIVVSSIHSLIFADLLHPRNL